MLDRFQAFFSDLSATIERIGTSQNDKTKAVHILDEMDRASQALQVKVDQVRREIESAS